MEEIDDLNAGYAGIDAIPTTTPEPIKEPEPEQPKFVQITEEQYQDLLSKTSKIDEIKEANKKLFDDAFGKIGGINRVLEQLKTPGEIDISEADFEELNGEFPELAALLGKDLKKALAKVRGPSADTSSIEKIVQERMQQAEEQRRLAETKTQQVAMQELEGKYADWKSIVAEENFNKWKQTLPYLERKELDNSWDPEFIADKIAAYKALSTPKNSNRKEILESAVTPRGVGGHASARSDLDEFNAGFASG